MLLDGVFCHACDWFPIEVICGGDSQVEIPCSTAGVV